MADEYDDDRESPLDTFNEVRGRGKQIQDAVERIKEHRSENKSDEGHGSEESSSESSGENADADPDGKNKIDSDSAENGEDPGSNGDKPGEKGSDSDVKDPSDTSKNNSVDNNNPGADSANKAPDMASQSAEKGAEGSTGGEMATATGQEVAGGGADAVTSGTGAQATGQAAGTAATTSAEATGTAAATTGTEVAATTASGAGASAGAAGTAAAASNPVGWVLLLVAAGVAVVKDLSKGADSKIIEGLVVGVAAIILLPLLIAFLLLMPVMAFTNVLLDTVHDAGNSINAHVMAVTQPEKVAVFKEMTGDIWGGTLYEEMVNNADVSQRGFDSANVQYYEYIIDYAIYNAFAVAEETAGDRDSAIKSIQDLIARPTDYTASAWYQYDYTANMSVGKVPPFYKEAGQLEYFRSLPYPYHVNADGSTDTIGEYLDRIDPTGHASDEIIVQRIQEDRSTGEHYNNDLNYAEIFAVFSQAKAFNEYLIMTPQEGQSATVDGESVYSWSYSTFFDMMTDPEVSWRLFELRLGGEDHQNIIYRNVHDDGTIHYFVLNSTDITYLSLMEGASIDNTATSLSQLHEKATNDYWEDYKAYQRSWISRLDINSFSDFVTLIAQANGRITNTIAEKWSQFKAGIVNAFNSVTTLLGNQLSTSYDYYAVQEHYLTGNGLAAYVYSATAPTFENIEAEAMRLNDEACEASGVSGPGYNGNMGYFYTMEVAPYGLKELYAIVDIVALNGDGTGFTPTSEFWMDTEYSSNIRPRTNVEYLNQQEEEIRCYLGYNPGEKEESSNGYDFFGPAYNVARTGGLAYKYMNAMTGAEYALSDVNPIKITTSGEGNVTGRSPITYFASLQEEVGDVPIYSRYFNPDDYNGPFVPTGESVILNFSTPDIYTSQIHGAHVFNGSEKRCRQGARENGRIYHGGCIDCSYFMVGNYWLLCGGNERSVLDPMILAMTPEESGCPDWVSGSAVESNGYGNGSFYSSTFLNFISTSMMPVPSQSTSQSDRQIQDVIDIITQGDPVVWEIGNGAVSSCAYKNPLTNEIIWYTSGHYMVIYGYDEVGFYILDPAEHWSRNEPLPYELFEAIITHDTSYVSSTAREFRTTQIHFSSANISPRYQVNTIRDGGIQQNNDE